MQALFELDRTAFIKRLTPDELHAYCEAVLREHPRVVEERGTWHLLVAAAPSITHRAVK